MKLRALYIDKKRITPFLVFAVSVLLVAILVVWPTNNTAEDPISASQPAAVGTTNELATSTPVVTSVPLFEYIEVLDSCGPHYEGTCINMRSGPGEDYPVVARLRAGMVLKVASAVTIGARTWYKIALDSSLYYPERVESDWYVASDVVHEFLDDGDHMLVSNATSTKYIVVDRSEQMLFAYEGDSLFMQTPISTGLEFTPTPRGEFFIFKMTPSRYMQGPLPSMVAGDQYYDLPGVPWNLYFTYDGAVIHGAYWHNGFGQPWSHGCVNLPPQKSKELYLWAEIGMKVIVRD